MLVRLNTLSSQIDISQCLSRESASEEILIDDWSFYFQMNFIFLKEECCYKGGVEMSVADAFLQ